MPKQKSRNKKISDAMKKRWAAKKAGRHYDKVVADDVISTPVKEDFFAKFTPDLKPQHVITVTITRPDGTVLRIEH